MTRKEEIKEAVKSHRRELEWWGEPQGYKDASCYGFKLGAKWADKTMLDKVCDWLMQYSWKYGNVTTNYLVEDLRKAMKGE